jgi:hypothetical protein
MKNKKIDYDTLYNYMIEILKETDYLKNVFN